MPKRYWCKKCNKNHQSGKIYEDHKHFALKDEPKYDIPYDRILITDLTEFLNLRIVAQRQIVGLWSRARASGKFAFYRQEINKLIMYERGELK